MASSPQPAVTPTGIRDGDPAALAALVERRANAVLAYCEAVCPPAVAERAAAEAFARFRAAVAAAVAPRGLDPEELLLGATRHAAASLTAMPAPAPAAGRLRRAFARGDVPQDACAQLPGRLAERAEGHLSADDTALMTAHLTRHPACRALADAVDRAEAAYASPPSRTVPIGALTEIMLALTAAAPITAAPAAALELTRVPVADEVAPAPDAQAVEAAPEPEPETEPDPESAAEPDGTVAAAEPEPDEARSGVLYRYVLPGAVLGVSLLAILGVAGVFGAEPSPRPSGRAPAATAPPSMTVPAPEDVPRVFGRTPPAAP